MQDEKSGRTSRRTSSPLSRLGILLMLEERRILSMLEERRRLDVRRSAMVEGEGLGRINKDAELRLLMIGTMKL